MTARRTVAPFGSWSSPVSPELLTEGTVRLSDLWVDGDEVWWLEARPADGGRQVVVRRRPDGSMSDVVPEGFSARTTVHEYGGGSYTVAGLRGPNAVAGLRGPNAVAGLRGPNAVAGLRGPNAVAASYLVFANFADQRLWAVAADGGSAPRPLTPKPPEPGAWRYADARAVPGGSWLVTVRERHRGERAADVVNDLVAVPVEGGEPVELAAGHDFFAAPRPSPDGRRLAWLTWDHPNMPWDGTELWVADLASGAGGPALTGAHRVVGGPEESVSQPRWSPDGRLHWVSDRTGWWNLYGEDQPLAPRAAEFSGPDWVFGQSTYTFLADGRLVAAWTEAGSDHLGVLDPATGELDELSVPFTRVSAL
ncbi:MAG TPA: hypothetical protein VHH09_01440, partial [Acidimicrobiales bacterium]|nr:hypothetical protein [Acidimicrobiales bacterium]